MDIGKQAVEVHKQVLESLKTPSEIARNLAVSDYYTSGARLHDHQRSAQYVADQVMIHQAGVRAQYEEMQKYEVFKRDLDKTDAEMYGDIKAPSMLAKITGMGRMQDIAKFYGKANMTHLIQIAEQMQRSANETARHLGTQGLMFKMTDYEKLLGKVRDYDKLLKNGIPLDKWNSLTPTQQQTAQINGGYPITEEMRRNATTARIMLDKVGKEIFKENYIPEPELPKPIINVTPKPGEAPGAPAGGTGTPMTQGWFGDLWRALSKPAFDEEAIRKAKEAQNPWS